MNRLIAAGVGWLLLLPPWLFAQNLVGEASILLPESITSPFVMAGLPGYDRIAILDGASLEVVTITSAGEVADRFGGWGAGAGALEYPTALSAAENSFFVLDEEARAIIRLDARLNRIQTTPLDPALNPQAFTRDNQQRFWVCYQDQSGVFIYDDAGRELAYFGGEDSGSDPVQEPYFLVASDKHIYAWEPGARRLVVFDFAGNISFRPAPPGITEPLGLTIIGDTPALFDSNALFLMQPDGVSAVPVPFAPLDVAYIDGQVLILEIGQIHVFRIMD